MENAEKQRWAKRLRALAERAGVHGDPDRSASSDKILSAEEKARLQLLVFTSGAPSTMANHIRRFEKFERWAHRSGIDFYPITDDKVLKCAMDLDARDCGPTVLPSLRTAIRWVAFRVNFKIPSIDTAAMKALEKDVFTKRGKPLKEAIPFDIELVGAMEGFVVQATHPTPARIFMWWVLCMIFASLRFDDAIHVKPHELEVRPEGLFGVSWQTKTERKRRGTKFVVLFLSLSVLGSKWVLSFSTRSSLGSRETSGSQRWRTRPPGGVLPPSMLDRFSGYTTWCGSRARMPASRRRLWTRSLT